MGKKGCCAKLFHVGDNVIIDPRLKECDDGLCVTYDMARHAGESAVIHIVERNYYIIEIEGKLNEYHWQDYMLLPDDSGMPQESDIFSFLYKNIIGSSYYCFMNIFSKN